MTLTTYRCVTANGIDGEVICIGIDESQGGQDYNGIGSWCNFTFTEIPQPQNQLLEFINTSNYMGSLLKVTDNRVVLKSLEEVQPVVPEPEAPAEEAPAEETPTEETPTEETPTEETPTEENPPV